MDVSRSVLGLALLALGSGASPCRANENHPSGSCPEGYWCSDGSNDQPSPGTVTRLTPEPLPSAAPRKLRRRHALSLRVTQAMATTSDGAASETSTGVGLSFRVRPMAWLGIEPALDLMRAYDERRASHTETNLGTDLAFYLNPRDAVQVYGLAGAHLGLAQHSEDWLYSSSTHVGAQLGAGLEFRVTYLLSFNVNMVGYTRRLTGAARRESFAEGEARPIPRAARGLALRAGVGFYF